MQYADKEDAEKCLEVANDPGPVSVTDSGYSFDFLFSSFVKNGGLILDQRELIVSMALSRDKVTKVVKQRKDQEKEKPDKRNLNLAREGCE